MAYRVIADTNRKSYMRSPATLLRLASSNILRSSTRSYTFQASLFGKLPGVGQILLLNTSKESYIESTVVL